MTRPPSGRHAGGILFALIVTLAVWLSPAPVSATPPECAEPDGKDTFGLEEPAWLGDQAHCYVSPRPTPTPVASPTPAATPTPRPVVGKWRYDWWSDSLTGKKFEHARLVATSRTGYGDELPTLYLRCIVGNPQWDVYIAWREFIGGDTAAVSYRFADDPVVALRWGGSTNNESTFLPNRHMGGFHQALRRLGVSSPARLVVRVWRYDDQTITASWNVAGAPLAIQRLTERCAA